MSSRYSCKLLNKKETYREETIDMIVWADGVALRLL